MNIDRRGKNVLCHIGETQQVLIFLLKIYMDWVGSNRSVSIKFFPSPHRNSVPAKYLFPFPCVCSRTVIGHDCSLPAGCVRSKQPHLIVFVPLRSRVYLRINRTLLFSFHWRFLIAYTLHHSAYKHSESSCTVFWFAYWTDWSATSVQCKPGSPGKQTSA